MPGLAGHGNDGPALDCRPSQGIPMKILARVALLGALLLAGCRGSEHAANRAESAAESTLAPILTTPDAVDVHSYARPLEARVTHIALDLTVDFDTKRIG